MNCQSFGVRCVDCKLWIFLEDIRGKSAEEVELIRVPSGLIECWYCRHKAYYPADSGKELIGCPNPQMEHLNKRTQEEESDPPFPEPVSYPLYLQLEVSCKPN
jgi:hypothetical protein